ncbi:PAAR domain-containing protein [Cupriavidus basilensis]
MHQHIRYNLVQGDKTSCNGIVVGASDARMTQMGVPLALEGDAVWCPPARLRVISFASASAPQLVPWPEGCP